MNQCNFLKPDISKSCLTIPPCQPIMTLFTAFSPKGKHCGRVIRNHGNKRAGTRTATEYGQMGESGEIPELARNCESLACAGLDPARLYEG